MSKRLVYLLLMLLFFGCSSEKSLDGESYMSWIKNPDNGLVSKKELKGIVFSTQYKPFDFIILNEEKKYDLPTNIVENRKKELDGMAYYNIRIKRN